MCFRQGISIDVIAGVLGKIDKRTVLFFINTKRTTPCLDNEVCKVTFCYIVPQCPVSILIEHQENVVVDFVSYLVTFLNPYVMNFRVMCLGIGFFTSFPICFYFRFNGICKT